MREVLRAASAPDAAARLNPFAFPSSTDARFFLLVVTVVSACLLTYDRLATRASDARQVLATMQRCNRVAQAEVAALARRVTASPEDSATRNRAGAETERFAATRRRCMAPLAAQRALWTGGGVLLVVAAAAAWYWATPAWIIRRRKLVPLPSEDDAPGLAGFLNALCAEAGLGTSPPTFLVAPLDRSATGLAFGRGRRYFVALGAGLVAQFYRDRQAFRAVVLHELAHLHNADVGKAYFTVAGWYAFLVVAALPDLLTTPTAHEPARWTVEWIGRVLALGALVYLTRNATLRAREVYADVRASTWDGPGGALDRVLGRLPGPRRPWQRYLLTHPDPVDRRRALGDTRPLFTANVWEAVGTGVAAMLAFSGVLALARHLIEAQAGNSFTVAPLAAAGVVGPLVAGVLGVVAWRGVFAALAQGQRPRGTRRVALAFVIGCLTASVTGLDRVTSVELSDAVQTVGSESSVVVAAVGLAYLAWGGIAFATIVLVLRWVEVGAETWLAASAEAPRTRTALVLACAMFVVCSGVLFPPLRHIESLAATTATYGIATPLVVLGVSLYNSAAAIPSPLAVAALATLWAYPCAAVLRAHTAESADQTGVSGAHWAFLDGAAPLLTAPPMALPAPRTAWRIGLLAIVPCAALLLAVHLGWWLRLDQTIRDTPATKLHLAKITVALVVLTQAAAAAVAARRAPRLPVVHGLCAAFVAASGAALVTFALFAALRGGPKGPGLLWFFLTTYLVNGALPAAGAAWLAAVLRRPARRPGRVGAPA